MPLEAELSLLFNEKFHFEFCFSNCFEIHYYCLYFFSNLGKYFIFRSIREIIDGFTSIKCHQFYEDSGPENITRKRPYIKSGQYA